MVARIFHILFVPYFIKSINLICHCHPKYIDNSIL